MDESARLESLFAQKLDQSIFGVYFLGAIVPLLGMAFLAQRYVVPVVDDQSYGLFGLIGLIGGVGALSLACFLALRRITRGALAQMDADNDRLKKLLRMSRELANAPHSDVVAATAAQSALVLLEANAAFVLVHSGADNELVLSEAAGDGAQEVYAAHGAVLQELVETAAAQGGHASLSSIACKGLDSGPHPIAAAAALVLHGNAEKSSGALIVIHKDPGRGFKLLRTS